MLQFRPQIKVFNSFIYLIMSLLLLTGCESRKTIINSLEEKEANEILVFLSNRGIEATKIPVAPDSSGGVSKAKLYDINVNSGNATEAMAYLNQAGLPRRRSQSLLGILGNTGLIPSPLVEKARFQVGLAEQIGSTIRKIDGVLDADVSISFPEEDPLNPGVSKQKITASVYIKHNGILDDPNAHLITRIKRLVAGSVNGLEFDNVTVIGDRARFGDALFGEYSKSASAQRNLVEIWGIVLSQDSIQKFRILFFSLSSALLLLIIFTSWLLWKFSLITTALGGFKNLFTNQKVRPKDILNKPEENKEDEEKKEEGDEENPKEEGEKTEEDQNK